MECHQKDNPSTLGANVDCGMNLYSLFYLPSPITWRGQLTWIRSVRQTQAKRLVIGQKTEFAHQALNWNRWTKSWYTTGYNTTPYKLGTFRSQTDPLHYGPHSAHLTDFGRAVVSSGFPSEISFLVDPRKCWKHEVERGSGGTCRGHRLPGREADRLRCSSSDHRWPPISQLSHRKSCFVRRYSIICSSYLLRFSTARNHT